MRRGNEWIYAEYDAEQATASVNEGKGNMGARMKLTMPMAIIFRYYVTVQKRSPYDARQYVVEALPGRDVPCLRTFYNHIEAGDMGVRHGDTPYHPGKRRRQRVPAPPARTVPGRRTLRDRPRAADERSELGHFEMDTVLSRRGTLPVVRSVTTDNGCEFLDQRRLDRAFRAEVYYTRAYASYEKGSVENCNRIVRRFFPKGTDFNAFTRREIRCLEDTINSIHRQSLNGETAYAYDSRMASLH